MDLVVILGPDPSEAFTAAQVVDGDVIPLGVSIDLFTIEMGYWDGELMEGTVNISLINVAPSV